MRRYFTLTMIVLLAVSCTGNRQQKSDVSPFEEETLPKLEENRVRAEGSGTSRDMHMAAEIARINAMTVLAAKAAPADTLTETTPDGIRTVETVNTPVFDVTEIDRRVFKNRTTGDFTVWILLEAEILP